MTEDGPALRRAKRHVPARKSGIAILTMALLLQACSRPGPSGSSARIYAADLSGSAKACDVPKVTPTDGQTLEAAMKLGNDGGWCGLTVRQPSLKPFDVGLLSVRPAHGSVVIHEVGDDTRIDYTPERGFTGSDSFAVKLIPGNALIRIAVTVMLPTGGQPPGGPKA